MNQLSQYSAIAKIGGIAIVLLVLALVALPLALLAAIIGIPAMIYYAWFSPDHAFPKPWENPLK